MHLPISSPHIRGWLGFPPRRVLRLPDAVANLSDLSPIGRMAGLAQSGALDFVGAARGGGRRRSRRRGWRRPASSRKVSTAFLPRGRLDRSGSLVRAALSAQAARHRRHRGRRLHDRRTSIRRGLEARRCAFAWRSGHGAGGLAGARPDFAGLLAVLLGAATLFRADRPARAARSCGIDGCCIAPATSSRRGISGSFPLVYLHTKCPVALALLFTLCIIDDR